ncbi:NAC transcription factor 47-like [Vicia villosa]|uniref:NAC transcription factor 47-like n=1 Tax=Vicia villosa TaxID=3911 RepID=UPI00273A789E|nr:NAC transcription factor 47-like [Vicia villosa]
MVIFNRTHGENRLLNYELGDDSRWKIDPSDEVLIYVYLRKKVHRHPLPLNNIFEFDVFEREPWMLDSRNSFRDRKYYFFDIKNHRFENMDRRQVGNGEWRSMEKNKEVSLPNNMFIGRKNTLEFWKIEGDEHVKTEWVMDEFRITPTIHPSKVSWLAAYRIFKTILPSEIDFTLEDENLSPPHSP